MMVDRLDSSTSPKERRMFSLFPKQEDFFVLFKKQGGLVREGCDLLVEMLEHYENIEAKAARLKDVEHQGDLVTHEIFEKLNGTFITPLEREDIHNLASTLDDVLDEVESIGARFVLYCVTKPTAEAIQIARLVAKCGAQIEQAVTHLKDFKNIMTFSIEINRLENEADTISRNVTAKLFSQNHDAIDVVRWKELYGRLEAATDRSEDVANIIESIVLKNR
jgi:predicted phosphate transport protein (TIGR00153 family)